MPSPAPAAPAASSPASPSGSPPRTRRARAARLAAPLLALSLAVALPLAACSSDSADNPAPAPGADASDVDTGSLGNDQETGAPAVTTIPVYDNVRIQSHSELPNFQKAESNIDFGAASVTSAKLIVDLGTTCFPFDKWTKPPAGQNWPADCDAFDRNFDIHLGDPITPPADVPDASADAAADTSSPISDAATPSAPPPAPPAPPLTPGQTFEVMHAITPFGGPLHREIDITDLVNGLPGKHSLSTHITTWSDGAGKVSGSNGGWNVSAHIEITYGKAPHKVLAVKSLIDTSSITRVDGIPSLPFTAPAGTKSARLEVRTSGHGGGAGGAACIGPAEEFCHRAHVLNVDGAALPTKSVWRSDCTKLCTIAHQANGGSGFDYCVENPCGAVSSVKAPRANWCPGSETAPFVYTDASLAAPGDHALTWTIDLIEGGGNWTASATYFAFGE